LRHALSLDSEAAAVEAAVGAAISAPRRTRDIGGIASCTAVAEAVAQHVKGA
jgi:isocitrate/isopropylmalate dehydrogenase